MYAQLPPLNSIKVFDAAARLKSFKKAAEELHVTPTAVSHQIKVLEEALGTLLFVRQTRAVQLTKDGERLAETVYTVLQQLTNVVNEISSTQNIITISTTSSFAAMWLVPNLNNFHQLYPNIEIAIKTGEHVNNMEKDRSIDLAIRYGLYDDSLKNSNLLTSEVIGMYATPNYIESMSSSNICLLEAKWQNKDLPSISWHRLIDDQTNNNKQYKVRQLDQEHHVIQAALAGQGVALVSTLLIENAIEQGWLIHYPFAEKIKKINGFSYYLVLPDHNIHNKCIAKFKDWLLNELSK